MGKNKKNDRRKNVTNKSKQLIKDFEKKKRRKLGRKLKPANATEISFSSHSIHISKQSLKDQNRELRKSLALITIDIQQALIGLSHHKCKVRRDVLSELKAILSRIEGEPKKFRSVLHANLVEIVSIFELVYDCEHIVRNTLKTFVNWFMPRCKPCIELFGPFWPSILAHLSAALSHINIKIRYNALKILRSFFSVSSVANYFSIKRCLSLLSHLELLFYDIIRNGHFILNDDDIKIVTCLRSNNNQNNNDCNSQKAAKTSSSHQETQVIVHVLVDCCMHILRVIKRQMHNNYDTLENNLHSLLLPNDNRMHRMELDGDDAMNVFDDFDDFDMVNSDNMQLLSSLLSIFASCCLIFEQFGAKRKYSAMSMVLTLCYIISECLCDETLKELINNHFHTQQRQLAKIKEANKNKKNKNKIKLPQINDYRIFISKSIMILFNVFPIEYVEKMQVNGNANGGGEEKEDEDENENAGKQEMKKLNVIQMNMKTIKMCAMFIEYWKLNLLQKVNKNPKKKKDYFKISYKWLHNSLISIASNDEKGINAKILVDLLQILKTLIPFYAEKKQLQLLLCVDKLMQNSQFRNDAKTIFAQFVN